MMILWGSPFDSFTSRNPSAPAPPALLMTTIGCFISLFLAMMPCTTRAIWSAPPPVPAGTTNSTVFVGSQAANAWAGTAAAAANSVSAAVPRQSRSVKLRIALLLLPGHQTEWTPSESAGSTYFIHLPHFARRLSPQAPYATLTEVKAADSACADVARSPTAEPLSDRHHQDCPRQPGHRQLELAAEDREDLEVDHPVGVGPEPLDHDRIGHQHLDRHVADQRGPDRDDHGISLHELHEHGRAENHQRDADQQPEHEQHDAALGDRGYRDDIVQAHHEVRDQDGFDRRQQVGARLDSVAAVVLGNQQLHRDPEQQRAADELEVGKLQQLDRDDGEHDAQHHRRCGSPDDRLLLLVRRQGARRQSDHDGVVAGQDDVDPDDRPEPEPELRRQKLFHSALSSRWPRRSCRGVQNSPTTLPSTRSILTADGTLGSPGIVMISPQIITTNSAPAASRTSRTLTTWFTGAARSCASVEKEYWVFATHTG